jgi:glycosyltransferase involved in cell wall biosynthesis
MTPLVEKFPTAVFQKNGFVIKLLNPGFTICSMDTQTGDRLLIETYEPLQQSLRIAVVTETWPPEVNGVALTLSKLVQQLSLKNHTIQLIRPRQDKSDKGEENNGWSEILLRGLPIPRYPQLKLGLPSKKALIKAWTQKRPDLIHIATEGPLGWSALQAARVLRLPVTSDFRTNFHSYSKHYGVGWLSKPIVAYLRKFHNHTACTMVPTRALKGELQASGFENLRVVARGVDTSLFNPGQRSAAMRASWQADDQSIVLLSAGRLTAEKNLDLIVNAYQALKNGNRPVRLVFAGDGPYREHLQTQCPDAVFMGMCSHQQLAVLYASADLFLFPSLTETFGNVTLEALSSGTPVLAFDCAAASELVQDNLNGWLVPGEDPQKYVLKALQITKDKATLAQAREHTFRSVENMDWKEIAAHVESIFRLTIDSHIH